MRSGPRYSQRGQRSTDWQYQGIIRLRPEDAKSLRGRYTWTAPPTTAPSDTSVEPATIWPGLAPHAPANVQWLRSEQYSALIENGPRWGELYLAREQDVALFTFYDH